MTTQLFRSVLARRPPLIPGPATGAFARAIANDATPPGPAVRTATLDPPGVEQSAAPALPALDATTSASSAASLQNDVPATAPVAETSSASVAVGGRGRGKAGDDMEAKARLHSLKKRMEGKAKQIVQERRLLADDRRQLSQFGSVNTLEASSKASAMRRNPPSSTSLTLATLVAAGAHLGHHSSSTSVAQYPFIYGTRADISVFDLRHTLTQLRRAAHVVRETVENDGIVVFLRGVKGSERAIEAASARLGKNGYAVTGRWLPGTLTNKAVVLGAAHATIAQNLAAEAAAEGDDGADSGPRRERKQGKDPEALKFEPSLMVVLEPHESKAAMREAALRGIPTIGLVDSDIDPRIVTYPIAANDDAVRTVELVVGVLGRAGEEGLQRRTLREAERKRFEASRPPRRLSLSASGRV